jgi:hypothetical protein
VRSLRADVFPAISRTAAAPMVSDDIAVRILAAVEDSCNRSNISIHMGSFNHVPEALALLEEEFADLSAARRVQINRFFCENPHLAVGFLGLANNDERLLWLDSVVPM